MDDNSITDNIFLLGNILKLTFAAADELPRDIERIKEYIGATLTCVCILFATKNKLANSRGVH